jgi:hypothetical protein
VTERVTQWPVICLVHGRRYLTGGQVRRQRKLGRWSCPEPDCGEPAVWDVEEEKRVLRLEIARVREATAVADAFLKRLGG